MSTTAITGATTATTDTVASGRNQLVQSFDTFLTLLTTQMKNQDPLSPMDSTQFTQQLVQMTGVEQQLATNDLLKQLVSNSGVSVASGVVDLIGKQVQATSDTAQLSNGQAQWQYTLDPGAVDVKLEVLDANGAKVAAYAPDDISAGAHSFTWDGANALGKQMSDGSYTLKITATDAAGNAVKTTTSVQGVVTGVGTANGSVVLTINGGTVPMSAVTSVSDPPTNSNNSAGQTSAAAA
jgi:flagellar basal-body rod modification protein FlgD